MIKYTDDKKQRAKKESIKCFEATIIGGNLKGKKILIPNINTTRSSKTILRESLFNTLQFDIIDKDFVEVFAGSGSIGLEAISRGATQALFIEKSKAVYDILRHNIKKLNISNAISIRGDSFEELEAIYKSIKNRGAKCYFYFDPPFSTREGMKNIYEKTLELIGMIEPSVCEMVIIEHMTAIEMPSNIGSLQKHKYKKFGKSSLSYYSLSH